jgi:flagellar basal-body rod protein FlgG
VISGSFEAINASRNEELRLSIISNNLANISVAGFKKDRLAFESLLRNQLNSEVPESPGGQVVEDLQLYRRLVKVSTDLGQGNLRQTGNPLDLALSGPGFFKVKTPQGVRYTRNGSFKLTQDGMIVTQSGAPVLGKSGPINASGAEITVDEQGAVFVDGNLVDTLSLATFAPSERLEKEGNSLYRPGPDAVEGTKGEGETVVGQGYLEDSNVQATEELVQMLYTVRAYESYQKMIRSLADMDSKAVNDAGRLR